MKQDGFLTIFAAASRGPGGDRVVPNLVVSIYSRRPAMRAESGERRAERDGVIMQVG